MKRFGKFRDPRFALTTLQNPTWEVRTRAELIQAAQPAIERQPDAPKSLPLQRLRNRRSQRTNQPQTLPFLGTPIS